ncbi:MAG: sn-glycerol-1-phosphate dehydrogenase, partial [Eubacterium sp.]|nr:sn-glycerol-1-phosphate dehydrogenase [Eubacterium sp.]
NLPSSKKMIQLLQSLGAPVRPSQVGISDEMTRDAIILAKEIRDRFTLLQMLWDTGLLESYAEEITASFRE